MYEIFYVKETKPIPKRQINDVSKAIINENGSYLLIRMEDADTELRKHWDSFLLHIFHDSD
jgi:hypothetical protein